MKHQVSKSQFKAKALEMLREVEATGQSIIVTDHGAPVVEVRRFIKNERSPLELLKGSVVEYSAPLEPVAENEWEALS